MSGDCLFFKHFDCTIGKYYPLKTMCCLFLLSISLSKQTELNESQADMILFSDVDDDTINMGNTSRTINSKNRNSQEKFANQTNISIPELTSETTLKSKYINNHSLIYQNKDNKHQTQENKINPRTKPSIKDESPFDSLRRRLRGKSKLNLFQSNDIPKSVDKIKPSPDSTKHVKTNNQKPNDLKEKTRRLKHSSTIHSPTNYEEILSYLEPLSLQDPLKISVINPSYKIVSDHGYTHQSAPLAMFPPPQFLSSSNNHILLPLSQSIQQSILDATSKNQQNSLKPLPISLDVRMFNYPNNAQSELLNGRSRKKAEDGRIDKPKEKNDTEDDQHGENSVGEEEHNRINDNEPTSDSSTGEVYDNSIITNATYNNDLKSSGNNMGIVGVIQNALATWSAANSQLPHLVTTLEHDGPAIATIDLNNQLNRRPIRRPQASPQTESDETEVTEVESFYEEQSGSNNQMNSLRPGSGSSMHQSQDYMRRPAMNRYIKQNHMSSYNYPPQNANVDDSFNENQDFYQNSPLMNVRQQPQQLYPSNNYQYIRNPTSPLYDVNQSSLVRNQNTAGPNFSRENYYDHQNYASQKVETNYTDQYPNSINSLKKLLNSNSNEDNQQENLSNQSHKSLSRQLEQLIQEISSLKKQNKIAAILASKDSDALENVDENQLSDSNSSTEDEQIKVLRKKLLKKLNKKQKKKRPKINDDEFVKIPLHALLFAISDKPKSIDGSRILTSILESQSDNY